MAARAAGSVQVISTITGTGDYLTLTAITGFETLATAGYANGELGYFRAEQVDSDGIPNGGFEEFFGTYNTTGPALARTTIIKSSNSDAAVSWPDSSTKRIFPINPGMMARWGEVSPAQLTANQNNWTPLNIESSVVRFSTDAMRVITGLAGGFHGRIVTLQNTGTLDAVLSSEDAASVAGNRFALFAAHVIRGLDVAVLQYDGITARWRLLSPLACEYRTRLDAAYTLTSTTTEQSLFPAAQDTFTLETGLYEFECIAGITGLSATSGNLAFDILGAGTATIAAPFYFGNTSDNSALGTPATDQASWTSAAQSAAAFATAGVGTAFGMYVKGSFEISVAGTIQPAITLLTAAAGSVLLGSYFKCKRVGGTALTTVGRVG